MKSETETDRLPLERIREHIDSIQEYAGRQSASFFGSKLVRDAALSNLQALPASTHRLSKPHKASEPGIPWNSMSAFRNALTRGYLGLNLISVRAVVERDPPILESAIERMTKAIASASNRSRST